jgi:hypothetical protein
VEDVFAGELLGGGAEVEVVHADGALGDRLATATNHGRELNLNGARTDPELDRVACQVLLGMHGPSNKAGATRLHAVQPSLSMEQNLLDCTI